MDYRVLITILLLVAAFIIPVDGFGEEALLFYASFEETAEPDLANGRKVKELLRDLEVHRHIIGSAFAIVTGKLEYGSGKKGKAVILKKVNNISYPTGGSIIAEKGTIEFWIKLREDRSAQGQLLSLCDIPNYGFFIDNHRLTFGEVNNPECIVSIESWDTTKWHHICLVWNSSENIKYLYVDTVLKSQSKKSKLELGEEFYLGSPETGNSLQCMIDEFRIWSRVISLSEQEKWHEGR